MSESNGKGRALGYCRASTGKQVMSPDTQKGVILERVKSLGLGEPVWYTDPEQSGGMDILERPAGRRLIADSRKGDTIVVAKLDRLSRNVRDLTTTVDTLIKRKVSLLLCDYGLVDFTSPSGVCFVHMMSVFAEFERRIIGARTKEAQAHRKALGQSYCNCPSYGFKYTTVLRDGKKVKMRVVDTKERELMSQLVTWFEAGWTCDQIREHLSYSQFNGQRGYPNINKNTGKEMSRDWSPIKVWKMIQAERKLRLKEQVTSAVMEQCE